MCARLPFARALGDRCVLGLDCPVDRRVDSGHRNHARLGRAAVDRLRPISMPACGVCQALVYFYPGPFPEPARSEEHTSELQSLAYLVCRLLLEKKKKINIMR